MPISHPDCRTSSVVDFKHRITTYCGRHCSLYSYTSRREKSESAPTQAQQPMLTHSRNLRLWILGKALPGAGWQTSGSLWNSVAVGSSDSPSITGVEDADSSVFSEPSEREKEKKSNHCAPLQGLAHREQPAGQKALGVSNTAIIRHPAEPARKNNPALEEAGRCVDWQSSFLFFPMPSLLPKSVYSLIFTVLKYRKVTIKCTVQW